MKDTGIRTAKILLPKTEDMSSWACIACDQFTSEPEYWATLEGLVKGKKTTLDMVLPEIYLEDRVDERIERINENIRSYLHGGFFEELNEGFILVVRSTPFVEKRLGLVGAVDLERYEYAQKSSALVRSTEGTIEERIPPRLKIRQNAEVEFPHVMILFDDEKREILEELYEKREHLKKVYDFELNMGGGHIEGYYIPDGEALLAKFSALLDRQRLLEKYGKADEFAFAVGDGNHSLATAKTLWERVKKTLPEKEKENHPARFALCEFVNVYDEGIYFEPIFRFVKGVDRTAFLSGLNELDGGKIKIYDGKEISTQEGENSLPEGIKAVDRYIQDYLLQCGGSVDYIHGEHNLCKLVDGGEDTVGIMFEKLDKADLFKYVSQKGAFPRKTFSMGEGIEKRYYLEGRKITK